MLVSDEVIKKALAWLSRQPVAMRREVLRLSMDKRRVTLNRLRVLPGVDARNSPEVEEQSLVAAIQQMRKPRLKSSDKLEEIAASRAAAAKSSKKKKSPKKDRLHILMPQILQLQESGMSYAEIATVLAKQTRKRVSRSYIHAVCTRDAARE